MNPDIHEQRDMPKRYDPQKHLDPRLRHRLTLYFFIALVLVGIAIYHIIVDEVSTLYPVIALALGMGLGALVSRMFHISWDRGAKQAISQFDAYGIAILVAYIFFAFFRKHLVEQFIHGPSVVAATFALFAGTMIGRLLGMRGRIKEVIHENL
jgi:hypothetical protein